MDAPVSSTGTTGSGIPVLSDHHLADGSQVVTISELGSTDPAKSTSIHSDGIDGDQGLTLNVINATTGKGLFLTAKADVTGGDAALHYNITGTSSVDGPGISLTPRIYKLTPAGDVLVFTGNAKKCTSGTTCTLSGDFVPVWDISNITSEYFANATVSFTSSSSYKLFSVISGDNGPDRADIIPLSVKDPDLVPEVVVTGELSPVPPGTTVSAEQANNTVPWGGTIEHSVDAWNVPMTVVYDASSKPLHYVNDTRAVMIPAPMGTSFPGTWVHEFPSGADMRYQQDKLEVYSNPGTKIFTALGPQKCPATSDIAYQKKNETKNKEYSGWLETAHDDSVDNLVTFTASWKVPTSPTSSISPRSIALFNAIQTNVAYDGVILQPVLAWDWSDMDNNGAKKMGHRVMVSSREIGLRG